MSVVNSFSEMTYDEFMCYYRLQTDRVARFKYELKWINQRIHKLSNLLEPEPDTYLEVMTLEQMKVDYTELLLGEEMYLNDLKLEYMNRFGGEEDEEDDEEEE